jgi:uncharacterized membrane protein required for colicin V production
MNYLDFILVMVVGGVVLSGFWFGFVHVVGSLVGLIFGAVIAGRTYEMGALWLAPYIHNANAAKFIAFILVYIIVSKVISLLFWLVERMFRFLTVIPFLRTFDRLLGAAFGLIEGTFLASLAIYFVARFPFSSVFADTMTSSLLARKFYVVGEALSVLLPGALKSLQSIF